jgi:hypothetical protein
LRQKITGLFGDDLKLKLMVLGRRDTLAEKSAGLPLADRK